MYENEPTEIDEYGNKLWKNKKGELHRIGDYAYKGNNGSKAWFIKGYLFRLYGPAVERSDGSKDFCIDGMYISGVNEFIFIARNHEKLLTYR